MNKELKNLKQAYQKIPIPDKELDQMIQNASQAKAKKKRHPIRWSIAATIPVLLAIFLVVVTTNESLARAMSDVPILKNIITVITGKNYQEKTKTTEANIKTPKLSGIQNPELEKKLNDAYDKTGEALYKEYQRSSQNHGEHFYVSSDYQEITNTKKLLVLQFTVQETRASSYTEHTYLVMDKQKMQRVELADLFKNDRYAKLIQANIQEQMKKQTEADPNKIYWDESELKAALSKKHLAKRFYINAKNELVFSFNDYEVAPGYMGTVSFVIPTSLIQNDLKKPTYLK
ncbi:anti-sigma-V factor RsiV [Listeria kieliensis]